jgi:hypothetical protein
MIMENKNVVMDSGYLQAKVEEMVNGVDSVNAEYILNDRNFQSNVETMERFNKKGDQKMVDFMMGDLVKKAEEYNGMFLTPANIKVGDGVTMHLYSDAHAGTVIKKTKTSVTVQRDVATIDPNFKPEITPGGFAGHCTNQGDQKYTYEQNPNGQTVTFRWSKKYNRFMNNQQVRTISKGRREFYDYNF